MSLYKRLIDRKSKLAVIGLGYVGMPIALAFSKKINVIGFDLNEEKVNVYRNGYDPTNEVGDEEIKKCTIDFTCDEKKLTFAKFFIVVVPTPINQDKTPDLFPVEIASEIIGRNMTKGSIVVFESTVYPGVTEDICIPILERFSGLKSGTDFKVGYSPERINPGDRVHTLSTIKKIVSGMDEESLEEIKIVYDLIIEAGTYPVSTIKTAEAIKVVENSQRDINIAFMNELAMVFHRMGIDTNEVIEGMNTKWNALGFRPGLVGGHCISVDPYYFTYEAEKLGYHSQIILAGRKVNDGMGEYVADAAIKQMILAGKVVKDARVVILGLTFKENCPDIRNSKVEDIVNRLKQFAINPTIVDPCANKEEVLNVYGFPLTELKDIDNADCIIIAVAHSLFKRMEMKELDMLFDRRLPDCKKVIVDVKGILDKQSVIEKGFRYWSL